MYCKIRSMTRKAIIEAAKKGLLYEKHKHSEIVAFTSKGAVIKERVEYRPLSLGVYFFDPIDSHDTSEIEKVIRKGAAYLKVDALNGK